MRLMRIAIILSGAMLAPAGTTTSALAFGAGGTAPGGPLSGGIRPTCNGYDMSGVALRGPCDGRSVDERRADAWRLETRPLERPQ